MKSNEAEAAVEPFLHDARASTRPRGGAGARIVRWTGAVVTLAGLGSWFAWLGWRFENFEASLIGVIVFLLELIAFGSALVVTAGLWAGRPPLRRERRSTDYRRPLPILIAEALDIGEIVNESEMLTQVGSDDTGEIAWARRGIRVLGDGTWSGGQRRRHERLREAAWSVVAVDGLRRLCSVVVLIIVLFSGTAPFPMPPASALAFLTSGIAALSIGHWLMSGGYVRPGSRLRWSMASIGAGLGNGVSRSGLPIRWVMTMATLVALNVSVALRGMSDRWTHGLEPMPRDVRVASMSLAFGLVAAGFVAMRRMPRPELGFYGATRRLEERSVRRLALGLTLLVAVIGFVAGVMPAESVIAAP